MTPVAGCASDTSIVPSSQLEHLELPPRMVYDVTIELLSPLWSLEDMCQYCPFVNRRAYHIFIPSRLNNLLRSRRTSLDNLDRRACEGRTSNEQKGLLSP